ncbi:MAG: glycosyltransferase family 4 protein [Planctomycetota bacterium]|nr:MAG: glycosyltransferase family 4 protein [Planctomycetota bacterium]
MSPIPPSDLKKIAIVGNYLPRRCGIATFTTDLSNALVQEIGIKGEVFALAMDDIPQGYRYPNRVRFQLRANVQPDYRVAADFIASNQANAVILQHEYGIYGGPAGAHVLRLLRELRIPVLTTLHTVLTKPSPEQRRVMDELWRTSDKLVVMSHKAEELLQEIYDVPPEKIAYIPHGIPDVPFVDPNYYKDQFKAEGRQVILTFGLLSPNKGIENMIEAMPEIVKQHPDTLYIVLGATHPHLKQQYGEAYRTSLQRRVVDLGLEENVRFRNRFVETDELCEYIGAADLYVTPYLFEQQITSGTLAYAVGAGKSVVSTPYWHAQEMLAEDRGLLVPFRDPRALAEALLYLFDNEVERHQMRKRAYTYCRDMVWKQVARDYLLLAQTAMEERSRKPRSLAPHRKRVGRIEELPELDLRHLETITDDTGMLQHAIYTTPDRNHGYCVDDNSRALVVCALYSQLYQSNDLDHLALIYLSFLSYAFNEKTGRFRNFMDYSRKWLDSVGSEDSHGRALWGLGMTAAHANSENLRSMSVKMFQQAVKATEKFSYPRAWAYSLLGIHAYLEHYGGDASVRRLRHLLAEKIFDLFKHNSGDDWPWCEPIMTYSNATLPHALLLAGTWIPHGEMRDTGLRCLEWVCNIQKTDRGHYSFIGNQGWYPRGGEKARFDQQPIEAAQLCCACAEAYRATDDERWLAESRRSLEWFLGRNDLDSPLYDFSSGGCCDGLTPDGPNFNQGAESTLAWLISLLTFQTQVARQTLQVKDHEQQVDKIIVPGEREPQTASDQTKV